MNEKRKNISALILAFIAAVISIHPCVMPLFMWRLPHIFLVFTDFYLKTGGLLSLAIAVLALLLVRRSQNRRTHKTVWQISFFSILMSLFWVISSIIIFIQNFRGN